METARQKIVTRFPPSPTGYLHIGNLRTALYNYFLARKHGGTFVLRIEDTDRERYVEGAVERLIQVLSTMGIDYDEGPIIKNGNLIEVGSNGPYTQSDRLPIYRTYVDQLLKKGFAYTCFCSKERLESVREQQQLAKQQTKYDRHCCNLSSDEVASRIEAGEPFVVRMKIPEGKTVFQDEIRGTISIENSEIDDQVLLKSDGFPTYHLAVVVDDHLMGVTHVVRGADWISSVPKHVILYNWFEFPLPVFAHLPLILNADKSKLSKRQGDVAVEDYLNKGYLPEALLNFISLLGFNPTGDREVYSKQELIESFELTKVNRAGAIFNVEKLNWMNSQYLRTLSDDELMRRAKPFLDDGMDPELLKRILHVEKERMTRLDEIRAKIETYHKLPAYDHALLVWKKSDLSDARTQLKSMFELLKETKNETFAGLELIEEAIKGYIERNGLQNGNVLWPLRVALSGSAQSASPFELLWVLGKQESLSRITKALNT